MASNNWRSALVLTRLSVTHVIFAHLSASPTLHIYLPTDLIFLGQCNLRLRILCCVCYWVVHSVNI